MEIIVSLALVSTILLVSLTASGNVLRNQSRSFESVAGRELAGLLLTEVSSVDFSDPDDSGTWGVESDETTSDRSTYDDLDDYDALSLNSVTYRDGSTIDSFAGWTAAVSVQPAVYDSSGVIVNADPESRWRLVSVRCTAPSGAVVAESMLLSNTPTDRDRTQTREQLRRLQMRFSNDRSLDVLVPLRNQPPMAGS